MVQQFDVPGHPVPSIPLRKLLPQALESTLAQLGGGASAAVLFTLEQKYGIGVNSTYLTLDGISKAILDLFGKGEGEQLLEKLWINLEERAEKSHTVILSSEPNGQSEVSILNEAGFNQKVSDVFSNFIAEMLGPDVHIWIESRLLEQSTTLKNSYFDADKISPILWMSFGSAADFLLNNMIIILSESLGVKPVQYDRKASLKSVLNELRKKVLKATAGVKPAKL